MRATIVAIPMQQDEPVFLESAMTKLRNDNNVKLMKASTKDLRVDKMFLNNTSIGMADTSPVDQTAYAGCSRAIVVIVAQNMI